MKRVLVIGDVIADVYRDCRFKKMCPDAPYAKAVVERDIDVRPGGAANVALNLCALSPDVQVDLIGAMDAALASQLKFASKNRINLDYVHLSGHLGGHIQKERILLDGEVMVRVDNRLQIDTYAHETLSKNLREYLANHLPDMVIISDYAGGAIYREELGPAESSVVAQLLTLRDRLLIDTKLQDLSVFDGSLLVKLNREEWQEVVSTEAAPERFFKFLVVTLGGWGAKLFMRLPLDQTRSVTHTMTVKGHSVYVEDVCGCGDTFLAGLASQLLRNPDPYSAVQFANAAAATVVGKPRTAVADREETLSLVGRTE